MLKALVKDSSVYFFIVLAWRLAGFITMPIYTRLLTPSDYGVMEAINRVTDILGLFLGFGLSEALLRHYYMAREPQEERHLVATAFTLLGLVVTCGAIVTLPAGALISRAVFGHARYTLFVNLAILSMLIDFIFALAMVVLRARRKMPFIIGASVCRLFVYLTTTVVFIVLLRWGIYGFFLGNLVTTVFCTALVGVPIWFRYGITLERKWLSLLLRFGLPLIPASFAQFLIHFSDRFFLVRYSSEGDLGLYSLAYKFGMLVSIGFSVLNNAWWPLAYKEWEENRDVFALRKPTAFMQLTLAVLSSSIILFAAPVIRLMSSPTFWPAGQYVAWLVLSYWVYSLQSFLSIGTKLSNRTTTYAGAHALAGIVSLLANLILIRCLGVWGAVWATVVSMISVVFFMWRASRRTLHVPQDAAALGIGMLAIVCSGFADKLLPVSTIIPVLLRGAVLFLLAGGVFYWYVRRYHVDCVGLMRRFLPSVVTCSERERRAP